MMPAVENANSVFAVVAVVLSAVFGTGGAGYAVLRWWLNRNDPNMRANAAQVITDASAGIIAELKSEKEELRAEKSEIKLEMSSFKTEVKGFILQVRELVGALDAALPLIRAEHEKLTTLYDKLEEVRKLL